MADTFTYKKCDKKGCPWETIGMPLDVDRAYAQHNHAVHGAPADPEPLPEYKGK